MYLESRIVSRKTPGDGKIEVSRTTFRSLEAAGDKLGARLGEQQERCSLEQIRCSCSKSEEQHDHYFVRSPIFRALSPDKSIRLDLDGMGLRLIVTALAILMLLLAPAAPFGNTLDAQGYPQTREGFFWGFGFGYGSLGCDDCGDEREGDLSGYIKLGGTVSRKVLLGFELSGWSTDFGNTEISFGSFTGTAWFYPGEESGFFLKGGLGIATLSVARRNFEVSDDGPGINLGLGYDARVSSNLSLTPYTNIISGGFDGGNANVFQFGIGLSWH